jgi:hypothetical protein
MDWIESESFRLFCPLFANEFVGREAFEGLEAADETSIWKPRLAILRSEAGYFGSLNSAEAAVLGEMAEAIFVICQ